MYFPKLNKSAEVKNFCAQKNDTDVCVIVLYQYQEHKAAYKELGSLCWAIAHSMCENFSYSIACTQEISSSTHLPSLTHQPQYGSLAWVHFSQSEYLWQSCTGSRCTWRTQRKANCNRSEEGTRRLNVCGQGCTVPWQQKTWPCIIMIRAQPEFKKIHTKPESGYFPLKRVQIYTFNLLSPNIL